MAAKGDAVFEVRAAVAAAIVTARNLPESLQEHVDSDQKFVVHPHVADVSATDPLLTGYLQTIYERRAVLGAEYPKGPYARLAEPSTVRPATQELATALAVQMAKKNANPGILFGFVLAVGGGAAHGVIKADLDDDTRFHFQSADGNTWSIDAVRELLPPPRTDYAKFAIAPQPAGDADVGVHDVTHGSSAADYFLAALGLTVPRDRGTQAQVAKAAIEAGYDNDYIRSRFAKLEQDRPVEDFVAEAFPKIPERKRQSLRGSANQPMSFVRADDPYISVYQTKNPHFKLEVDRSVDVRREGRVFTVTLPEGSDVVESKARR